jgi:hypothetical protein
VRGTRATEVKGAVSPGATLLVPARKELADGRRVRTENVVSQVVQPSPPGSDSPGRPETSRDYIDQEIATSLSTHLNNIVSDARRDARWVIDLPGTLCPRHRRVRVRWPIAAP